MTTLVLGWPKFIECLFSKCYSKLPLKTQVKLFEFYV
jgi:hypothetical protein